MKLIKPYYEIWNQTDYSTEGIYRQVEKVGRVCYKSEDRITDTSSKPFVEALIKSQHYAMLEHGTVYLKLNFRKPDYHTVLDKYYGNKYSAVKEFRNDAYITTNYRVIVENHWEDDLKYLCEPTDYHEKRITVHFVCNRQVSHEFVRHKLLCVA